MLFSKLFLLGMVIVIFGCSTQEREIPFEPTTFQAEESILTNDSTLETETIISEPNIEVSPEPEATREPESTTPELEALTTPEPEAITPQPNIEIPTFTTPSFTNNSNNVNENQGVGEVEEKRCGKCNQVVPVTSKAGEYCPHCGVYWDIEETEYYEEYENEN